MSKKSKQTTNSNGNNMKMKNKTAIWWIEARQWIDNSDSHKQHKKKNILFFCCFIEDYLWGKKRIFGEQQYESAIYERKNRR